MRTWLKKATLKDDQGNPVRCLIPADEVAEEDFVKLSNTKILRADIVAPRNLGLHRKAFILLNKVFPHTEYPNIEVLRKALTVGAGFVDSVVDPLSGEVLWYPRSWEFERMDDIEFQELYSRMIDVALKIVPNSKRQDWEEAVNDIVRM